LSVPLDAGQQRKSLKDEYWSSSCPRS